MTTPEESLSGRVALVTGGTRGIGAAICNDSRPSRRGDRGRLLVQPGAGRRIPAGAAGQRTGRQRSPGQRGRPRGLRARRERGDDEHGRLDILVNNAGVTMDRPVSAMTVDDWHTVLRVNLSGAFYMSKPALAHMLDRGSGRIINISSITGEIGNIGQANYM